MAAKIGADSVISSSRTALHVGALFLRNRHPSNASSLRLSPRGLTTLRGPRSSIRQYAGVLFLVIIRFSLAEKSCGVFAREKWRQRKRGAAGRLAPVNATHKVGRYLYPQKPYLLLPSEGIFITGAGRIHSPAVLRRSAPAWHGGSETPRRRNIWPRWGIPLHRPGT